MLLGMKEKQKVYGVIMTPSFWKPEAALNNYEHDLSFKTYVSINC